MVAKLALSIAFLTEMPPPLTLVFPSRIAVSYSRIGESSSWSAFVHSWIFGQSVVSCHSLRHGMGTVLHCCSRAGRGWAIGVVASSETVACSRVTDSSRRRPQTLAGRHACCTAPRQRDLTLARLAFGASPSVFLLSSRHVTEWKGYGSKCTVEVEAFFPCIFFHIYYGFTPNIVAIPLHTRTIHLLLLLNTWDEHTSKLNGRDGSRQRPGAESSALFSPRSSSGDGWQHTKRRVVVGRRTVG